MLYLLIANNAAQVRKASTPNWSLATKQPIQAQGYTAHGSFSGAAKLIQRLFLAVDSRQQVLGQSGSPDDRKPKINCSVHSAYLDPHGCLLCVQGVLSSFFYKFADTILKKYSSTIATVFTALMSYALFAHELTVNFFIGVAIVFISMHQFFTFGEQVSALWECQRHRLLLWGMSQQHRTLSAEQRQSWIQPNASILNTYAAFLSQQPAML